MCDLPGRLMRADDKEDLILEGADLVLLLCAMFSLLGVLIVVWGFH